jgi:hypothetical protein
MRQVRWMSEQPDDGGLKVVDAFDLDDELRGIFRPGDMVRDSRGNRHKLPRYFYEIPSEEEAREIRLTTHFYMHEFVGIDLKEHQRLQQFPRYIPCAVRILAFYLQRLREAFGASIHIAVNGGYRSPSHQLSAAATPHMWGTAADVFRIGTNIVKDHEMIDKYGRIAVDLTDDFRVRPFGQENGEVVDHMHLDLGYVTVIPREVSEDRMELPQQRPRFAFEERRRGDRRGQSLDDTASRRAGDPVPQARDNRES